MGKAQEGTKILQMLKPVIDVIPEVQRPLTQVAMDTKQIWTGIVVLVYLLCCQIPLYGIIKSNDEDPFFWMRTILASNRGSLMQLGIQPIITASMIMQLLNGAKIINIDQSVPEEKQLYEGSQKIIGIIIAFVQAFGQTYSGLYGDLATIGVGNIILIVLQLTLATFLTIMLDDIMSKGYGIGSSATSLFIAINMAQNLLWSCFSPIKNRYSLDDPEQYEGSIVQLFYGLIFSDNKLNSMRNAFFRSTHSSISNILTTILVLGVAIYVQQLKVNLKMSSKKSTEPVPYSINLFYTSNMPIILQSALVSNVYYFAQMFHQNFKGSLLTRILGVWQSSGYQGQIAPVGGLVYYITSPRSIYGALMDPLHTIVYILFMIGSCAIFSTIWVDISGQGPKQVAKNLKKQGICLKGSTDDGTYRKLNQLIMIAASLGGVCTGLLTIFADFLGVIGSGTGIMLAITIIYGLYEQIQKAKSMSKKGGQNG